MQPTDLYYTILRLFSEKRCVNREEIDSRLLEELSTLGLVYQGLSGEVCVKSIVELAIFTVRRGCDPKNVSGYLSWRDFESFVAEALEESGYYVFKNFRFGVRRWEFDVLAVNTLSSIALAVDCKHWSPRHVSVSKIRTVSLEHINKLKLLLDSCGYEFSGYPILRRARHFFGVVVTMSELIRGSVEGVGIVPIYYFRDFLENLSFYVEELKMKPSINPCFLQDRK